MHLIANAHELTEAEQELLLSAVRNRGVLEIVVRSETRGRAVVAGRKKFFDPNDCMVATRFISLLARLKELALIHEMPGKKAYELTNYGWQLSRSLGR